MSSEREVFRPNKKKVLALDTCLKEYHTRVNWYLNFNSASRTFLHRNGYANAKQLFNLNTALIQTARALSVIAGSSPEILWNEFSDEAENLLARADSLLCF